MLLTTVLQLLDTADMFSRSPPMERRVVASTCQQAIAQLEYSLCNISLVSFNDLKIPILFTFSVPINRVHSFST